MKSSYWLVLALLVAGLLVLPFLLSEGEPAEVAGAEVAQPTLERLDSSDPVEPLAPERARLDAPAVSGGGAVLAEIGGLRLPGPGRLSGRVVDAAGQGLADLQVELHTLPPAASHYAERILRLVRRTEWVPNTKPLAGALTDAEGVFEFEGLRSGDYFLDARGEWWVSAAPVQVHVNTAGSGGPVDVLAVPAGSIAGRVVDERGAGVSGAKVAGFHGAGVLLSALRNGEARFMETRTDREGHFELLGLPPGPGYDVAATGSSFAVSHVTDLTVVAHETTRITVSALEGATLVGTVLTRALDGEDAAGADEEGRTPVAGAHVGALPLGLRSLHFAPEILATTHVETDAKGRFVMRHVPPGEVDVIAWAPAHLPGTSSTSSVINGERAEGVEVELRGGALIDGKVTDGEGKPLGGVRVRWDLMDGAADDELIRLSPFLAQAVEGFAFPVTGDNGLFTAGPFLDNPPHDLQFEKGGYESVSKRWNPEDGLLEVELLRGGSISGIVMDAARAEPLTEFTVLAPKLPTPGQPLPYNPISGGEVIEDPDGRFRIDGIEVGNHTLLVSAPGYRRATVQNVEVVRNEETKGIIVSLVPGGSISGVVVDPDGRPVANAQVLPVPNSENAEEMASGAGVAVGFSLGMSMGMMADLGLASGLGLLPPSSGRSDERGRFELIGVEPGEVRVAAVHRDFAGGSSEMLFLEEGGQLNDVEVALTTGGGIYGQVTDMAGAPVERAIVVAVSPGNMGAGPPSSEVKGGGFAYQDLTDEEGGYSMDNMSPGSYFVVVTQGDEALNLLSFMGRFNFDLVHVPEGRRVEHDVLDTSASACRVHGRVLLEDEPTAGGAVVAMSNDADNMLGIDFKMARVDANGFYEFSGLQPGEYQFMYEHGSSDYRKDVEVPEVPDFPYDLHLPEGRIEGMVVDAVTGDPIQYAYAELRALDDGGGNSGTGLLGEFFATRSRVETDWVGDDGEFSFRGLSQGDYELLISGPRWGEGQGEYGPAEPMTVELSDGQVRDGITVRLDPSLSVSGIVVDPAGAPMEGARVSAFAPDGRSLRPATDRSDQEGRFEIKGLAAGPYQLAASHDDLADSKLLDIELPSPQSENVRLELTQGAHVEVRVYDSAGQPISGAFATLVGEEGNAITMNRVERSFEGIFDGSSVTNDEGILDLGRFTPGTYRLEVRRGSKTQVIENVELAEGASESLTVRMN